MEIVSKRIPVFDVAKGIAIVSMVLGHILKVGYLHNFIYLFHMVFFFVLAGYFFKDNVYSSFKNLKDFVAKKIKRLLIPYLFFNILFELCHNFFIKIHFYTTDPTFIYKSAITQPYTDLKTPLTQFFLHIEPLIAPSWFLFVLFMSLSLYALINYICYKIKYNFNFNKFLIILLCLNLGFYIASHHIKFLYICTILSVQSCLYIGEIFSKNRLDSFLTKAYFILIFALYICLTLILKNPISISVSKYYNPALLIFLSITAFIFVIFWAQMIKNKFLIKCLDYIGKNTIPILLLHVISFKLVTYVQIIVYKEPIINLASFYVYKINLFWIICYLTVGIVLPLLINFVYLYLKNKWKGIYEFKS